jgi:hypothetical protein
VSNVDAPLGVPSFDEIDRPRSPSVREGLPPGYRMRADSHYIDHLESRQSSGHEWLDPQSIDAPLASDDGSLGELVDSIRKHGILQPLLVQHTDGRYHLIAGQRRRRAAILAGLRRVPCVLHAVDDDAARALGVAANIRAARSEAPPRAVDTLPEISRSLETLSVCGTLMSGAPSDLSRGISTDLIGAEAWRAFCIVEATRIVQHGAAVSRRLISPRGALDRVARSFGPEFRLRNVTLELDVDIPDARLVMGDEHQLVIALAAAVISTMALFERTERGAIRLSAAISAGQLACVVAQNAVAVPESWASRAFDQEWTDRPGGTPALASMLALKRIAEGFGGDAAAAVARRGTSVTLTIPTV